MSDLSSRLSRLPTSRRTQIVQRLRAGEQPPTTAQLGPERTDGPLQPIAPSTLDAGFATVVASAPTACALVDEDRRLDYAGLDRQANRIAQALIARGIGRGDLVPVHLARSATGVAALLGVLKSGAAYVPLDPALPTARISAVLTATGARVVLATPGLVQAVDGSTAEPLDPESAEVREQSGDAPAARSLPSDPAYVLFTSGTSGTPKGVVVQHRAAHHFVTAIAADYEITQADRLLQFASYGFDVSVFELFTALLTGACLVIVRDRAKHTPEQLTTLMREQRVTVAELPPALMPLLDPEPLTDLRLVSVGGEAFPGHLIGGWATPTRRFVNGYGPTECTVAVTLFDCVEALPGNPPIGRPMANHRAFVLDSALRPVPEGTPGELCIAGPQLAQGYLGQPELTAERFPANPYTIGREDERLYRTGDQVRWLPDGNLEFLGRTDRQIQVRGFRVEPGEIEACLAQEPTIGLAAVKPVAVQGRPPLLVAYVTPSAGAAVGTADPERLKLHVSKQLPSYMVPHAVICLPELPLTVNGKVDLGALPAPDLGSLRDADVPEADTAPQSDDPVATHIATALLAPLLGAESLAPATDFFAAGGDSLQAIRCVGAVTAEYGVPISVVDFLAHPTAQYLADLVRAGQQAAQQQRTSLFDVLDDIESSQTVPEQSR